MPKSRPRAKPRDSARRGKKKVSVLTHKRVEYVDYKDVDLLRRFMSDRGKIRARRVTGNDEQQQRTVAQAIKNAREMALLPYANRVTTQRGAGRSGQRANGGPGRRADGPPPSPSLPPPPPPGSAAGSEGVEPPPASETAAPPEAVEQSEAPPPSVPPAPATDAQETQP